MLKILKNAHIYSPENLGKNDILIANDKILAIDTNLDSYASIAETYDFSGQIITPGLIDQHIHIAGAGGTSGFFSMTPEVHLSDLIACGSTTVVGLLGTDGKTRSIRTLYGKVKSLEQEGISAYMYCGYYGIDSVTITDSIQSDMIFIDKVLGCKIAISDIRSSYPTALELLRKVSEVRVGGSVANKKGILHIHLGNLDTKMDVLFELVQKHEFPIAHISPTHVGRTKELFEQAIEFAKLGGTIDITTGASKFTEPYKAVLMALENGAPLKNITFSTDGHAGLRKINENGKFIEQLQLPKSFSNIEAIKHNAVFEGLSQSVDNLGFWVAMESPLSFDGEHPTFEKQSSPIRITYFDKKLKVATKQFAYQLEKIPKPYKGNQNINGATAILELQKNHFLIVERSYQNNYGSKGNTIKIFEAFIDENTTDILEISSLKETVFLPLKKKLLFNFESIKDFLTDGIIDNLEGITLGPKLKNGNQSLILVADDNFQTFGKQLNQFILLEIKTNK